MTADEARKTAYIANTDSRTSQLSTVMEVIKKAASAGNYYTDVYQETIRTDVQEELAKMGYSVKYLSERNDGFYRVSWESKK